MAAAAAASPVRQAKKAAAAAVAALGLTPAALRSNGGESALRHARETMRVLVAEEESVLVEGDGDAVVIDTSSAQTRVAVAKAFASAMTTAAAGNDQREELLIELEEQIFALLTDLVTTPDDDEEAAAAGGRKPYEFGLQRVAESLATMCVRVSRSPSLLFARWTPRILDVLKALGQAEGATLNAKPPDSSRKMRERVASALWRSLPKDLGEDEGDAELAASVVEAASLYMTKKCADAPLVQQAAVAALQRLKSRCPDAILGIDPAFLFQCLREAAEDGRDSNLLYVIASPSYFARHREAYLLNLDLLVDQWPDMSLSAINMICECGEAACLEPYAETFVQHASSDSRRAALSLSVIASIAAVAPACILPHVDTVLSVCAADASATIRGGAVYAARVLHGIATHADTSDEDRLRLARALLDLLPSTDGTASSEARQRAAETVLESLLAIGLRLQSHSVAARVPEEEKTVESGNTSAIEQMRTLLTERMDDIDEARQHAPQTAQSIKDFAAGRSLEQLDARLSSLEAKVDNWNGEITEQCQTADEVYAYVDARMAEMREFLAEVTKKLPMPSRLAIVEGSLRKEIRLVFTCPRSGFEFPLVTTEYRKWLKVGFQAVKLAKCVIHASMGNVVGAVASGVQGIKEIYDTCKASDDEDYVNYIQKPFLSSKESDELISRLEEAGFFEAFFYDAQTAQWCAKDSMSEQEEAKETAAQERRDEVAANVTHEEGSFSVAADVATAAKAVARAAAKEMGTDAEEQVNDAIEKVEDVQDAVETAMTVAATVHSAGACVVNGVRELSRSDAFSFDLEIELDSKIYSVSARYSTCVELYDTLRDAGLLPNAPFPEKKFTLSKEGRKKLAEQRAPVLAAFFTACLAKADTVSHPAFLDFFDVDSSAREALRLQSNI